MNEMLISVIIPVYNAEKYLEKCIKSLICQTYRNIELIFIDDSSNDRSYEIVQKYMKLDDRIRLYSNHEKGVSNARNYGLIHATGEWIYFVDADDYVNSNTIKVLINLLEQNESVELLCFGYNESHEGRIITNNNFSGNSFEYSTDILQEKIFNDNRIKGYVWNKFFKASVLSNNGICFDSRLPVNEDLLFCYQYIKHIKVGVYIDLGLYTYVKHDNSAMDGVLRLKQLTSCCTAFDIILSECEGESSYRWAKCAFVNMLLFLSKKGLKHGCESDLVKEELHKYMQMIGADSSVPLRKKPRAWRYFFLHFPFIYKIMKVRKIE